MTTIALGLATKIKVVQPGNRVDLATRDRIETILHTCRKAEVDQIRQVLLEQVDYGKGSKGRHQRRAFVADVASVLNGLNDRRIRRWPTDAAFFEFADQAGLGVAALGLGEVLLWLDALGGHLLILLHRRQHLLLIIERGGGIVAALDIRTQEARKRDNLARRGEHGGATIARRRTDAHVGAHAFGVFHLRCHGAFPDQFVQTQLVGVEFIAHLLRRAEGLTRRPDGFVSFLGVFRPTAIDTGLVWQVFLAI